MAENSKIEWTDDSWNPIRARATASGRIGWHCEHVSEGCRNCYAERQNRVIFGNGLDYKPGLLASGATELFLDEVMLLKPLRRRGTKRIFVCSMTDLFADFVPDWMRDRIFAVMALCPQHQFQVLTKRADRMREYLVARKSQRPIMVPLGDGTLAQHPFGNELKAPPHIWLGVSVEDQSEAEARIPDLLAAPVAVRFLSCEPLLGPVDLTDVRLATVEARCEEPSGLYSVDALTGLHVDADGAVDGVLGHPDPKIDWVIVGGESGFGKTIARPMHPDWARGLRDQCAAAEVPFFFKQWGEWAPLSKSLPAMSDSAGMVAWPSGAIGIELPPCERGGPGQCMYRGTKSVTGRLLDGFEHNGMPV